MSAGADGSWILGMLQAGELQDEHRREMAVLLTQLLEVMDSCDRLLAAAAEGPDPHGVTGSWQLVAHQLGAVLERANVRPMPCLGRPVDLEVHEIVGVRPATVEQAGVVLEEVRRGYEWDGRLLRAAQVVVGRSSEEIST